MDGKVVNGVSYSKREIEVIACICAGCSAKVIARILNISSNTVNSHIQNIMHKSNIYSKHEIIKLVEASDEYDFIQNKYRELRFEGISQLGKISFEFSDYDVERTELSFMKKHKLYFFAFLGLSSLVGVGMMYCKEHSYVGYELPQINDRIFLQRIKIVDELDKRIRSKRGLRVVALVGEAGIGKTTIARSYLGKHSFFVKAEINAESEFKIIKSFEDLLFLLCKTDHQHNVLQTIKMIKDLEEKGKKLKAFLVTLLKGYKNWCFLYDNVEDLTLLKKWLPQDCSLVKNGVIIITTRNDHIKNIISSCVVDVVRVPYLSYGETAQLFCNLLNWSDCEFVYDKEVVKSLLTGFPAIPLDILSIAYFIKINNITLKEYDKMIKKMDEDI